MAVALYARVSTGKQAEKDLSLPDQLRQMREWCQRNGYSIGAEYVEPGASATDDRRPEFQRMVADATVKPSPFEAIIVHSLSRFFRDFIEFALYERRLNKSGVKVVSITQQTSDDPAGEMARRIFSMFDEYQSKENGKHTLRAMKENARQGFFNGARPPFGYKVQEVDLPAAKGKKKRLVVDEAEATIVQRAFELYLYGLGGADLGYKEIAAYFNARGQLLRGRPWARSRVHQMLIDSTYKGLHIFNKGDGRASHSKPESEWIMVDVQPVVSADLFDAVARKRRERSPSVTPPRQTSSPTLLTGLLKCANCGAGMTTATGKSGRYRYYKCNTRLDRSIDACSTPSISMPKLDALVIGALVEKVLTPSRLRSLFQELQRHLKSLRAHHHDVVQKLRRDLAEVEASANRLYEAVEKDLLPMDDLLRARAQTIKSKREALLLEIAATRRHQEMPLASLSASQIDAFGTALRQRLTNSSDSAVKRYIRQYVAEIRFDGRKVLMRGSNAAILAASAQEGSTNLPVPTSISMRVPYAHSNCDTAAH